MPSFADSAVIFILALILFGPKKLPQLARQLGKLMAEFRRASNEFRMQMEDELRIEEQKEHQRKVDAMAGPPSTLPEPEHPHLPSTASETAETHTPELDHASVHDGNVPIAESGSLRMMPPSTGLPIQSGTYGISQPIDDTGAPDAYTGAVTQNGHLSESSSHNGHVPGAEPAAGMSSEEPLHDSAAMGEQTHA